eukprot:TRINITY_DN10329_c0_g1_i8.p1 TRINITY_DN10329_c0_g1~~TRINITY_DN10329_c0_g1_i8.p1  ORF type:complete len:342 (+),score=35.30 TRINITY_DN10329_c0_g1_i8:597-1622(+)
MFTTWPAWALPLLGEIARIYPQATTLWTTTMCTTTHCGSGPINRVSSGVAWATITHVTPSSTPLTTAFWAVAMKRPYMEATTVASKVCMAWAIRSACTRVVSWVVVSPNLLVNCICTFICFHILPLSKLCKHLSSSVPHPGNHLEDLAFETDDTGAFYTCGQQGQAWINRGNVIVNNTFKSVRRTEPTTLGFPSVQAVYLDDEMSGWIVTNNTFIDCQKGVFVGGGRKTHVYNNTFYNVDTALHLDNRGMNWQAKSCNNATGDDYLTAEKYRRLPAWQPYNITLDHNCVPVYNTFVDNTCCHCQSITDFTAEQLAEWMSSASNNVEVCNATRYRDESDLTI